MVRRILLPLILALVVPCARAAEEGLVAHWTFDEGAGDVLHDRSGNGNDGKIHDARWVKTPNGTGLEFAAKNSYVDFGDNRKLKLAKDTTILAWLSLNAQRYPDYDTNWTIVNCESYNNGGYVLRVDGDSGKLILRTNQKGSSSYARSVTRLLNKRKCHVAVTRSGEQVDYYLNGFPAGTYAYGLPPGRSAVKDPHPTDRAFRISEASQSFAGVIEDLRMYHRSFSAEEIAGIYRQEGRARGVDMSAFRKVGLRAHVHPRPGKVIAWLDARRVMPLPKGARVVVELAAPGEATALSRAEVAKLPSTGRTKAVLDAHKLPPGSYVVRVDMIGADGNPIGERNSAPVQWPGRPEEFRKIKVLNNLCWELLNTRDVGAQQTFALPCDRWVFIRTTAKVERGGEVRVGIDSDLPEQAVVVHSTAGESTLEAMRFLKAGDHAIHVRSKGRAKVGRLVVRAIPMLQYSAFFPTSHIKEYGPYDWDFLKRDVLPNINTMIAINSPDQIPPHLDEWKAMGRKWIQTRTVPWKLLEAPAAVDKVYDFWASSPGLADPRMDGLILDEFKWRGHPGYDTFGQVVERIFARPEFRGKMFIPYGGTDLSGKGRSTEFARTCARLGGGYLCAWERYLGEPPTLELAERCLNDRVVADMMSWEECSPGAASRLVMVYGFMSQPPENLNAYATVDYRVWMDMQTRLLATDPVFFGLGGIQWYLSSYCDEENLRLAGRLYRHYAIEGNAEPLIKEPYNLTHIQNPDFENGTAGWTISPAEPGSICTKTHSGYSWLQGRYPHYVSAVIGNTFLVMKRSAAKPNTFSQEIRTLQPGRLYSMKMITADYQDLVQEKSHKAANAVTIKLDDVEILPGPKRSFQSTFANCYSHRLGKFGRGHRYYMNYHWRVFRAKGTSARLTVSDWTDEDKPGGPADQELMFNFIEIQPYLDTGD